MKLPEQGDMVIYRDDVGATWPAMVVLALGRRAHLRVFDLYSSIAYRDVPYAPRESKVTNSWHWKEGKGK